MTFEEVRRAEEERTGLLTSALRGGYCPKCGKILTEPGYGTGRLADGLFCSFRCFSDFWYGPSS